jgi:hypothetical protein
MVAPVTEWQEWLSRRWTQSSPLLATSLFYAASLVLLPLIAVGTAAALSRWWGQLPLGCLDVAMRYSFALVPLGFGMWLAHYAFHFLTSHDAVVPATQRFTADLGWTILGTPDWRCNCCRPVMDWLLRVEILALDLGLLLSLYTAYRISVSQAAGLSRALRAMAPWALLLLVLFGVGIWILFQPMQMRGTLQMMG